MANLDQQSLSKLVLLTDCMSAVAGFETEQREFIDATVRRGLQMASAVDLLPELLANANPAVRGQTPYGV